MWIRAIVLVLFSCSVPLSAADLWRPLGPGGGIPVHVAPDPLAPRRLFAIWRSGFRREVYRRDAGAASWSFVSRGLEGVRPQVLAFHPVRSGTLWAAGHDGSLRIHRSTDAGASWQPRFTGGRQVSAFGLWSIPRGREVVLLGWFGFSPSTAKLSRSGNGGQSWKAIDGIRGPVAVLSNTETAFAPGLDGRALFVSRSSGTTWTPSGALPVDANVDPIRAFAAVSGGNGRPPVLLVSFEQAGLFRSTDRGTTWSLVGPAGPGPSSIVAAPQSLFAAFESGLHQSSDRGATWRPRSSASFPEGQVYLAAESPSGALYAVSDDSLELSQSRDGGRTWTHAAQRGVQQFSAEDFAWHPLEPRVQAILNGRLTPIGSVGEIELQWTIDNGATWRRAPFRTFAFDPRDPGVLYGGSESGVSVTRDHGATWISLRSEPATTLAHSGAALFAGGCGIARSEDDGGHWTEVLPCQAPPSPHLPSGGFLRPTRLLPHLTDPDVIWAEVVESVTIDGFTAQALYGSFDGGSTWERRNVFYPQSRSLPDSRIRSGTSAMPLWREATIAASPGAGSVESQRALTTSRSTRSTLIESISWAASQRSVSTAAPPGSPRSM